MSILSRVFGGLIAGAQGKPDTHAIIDNPTTPIEKAVNVAAAVILPEAGLIPGAAAATQSAEAIKTAISSVLPSTPGSTTPASGTGAVSAPATAAATTLTQSIAAEAKTATDAFLTEKVGNVGDGLIDASAFALATAAISKMPTSTKTEQEIETGLHSFLTDFFAKPA